MGCCCDNDIADIFLFNLLLEVEDLQLCFLVSEYMISSIQIPGGVTAAEGFKAAGMYGGLRAKGEKPDLALVTCDVDAISAG